MTALYAAVILSAWWLGMAARVIHAAWADGAAT